MGIRNEQLRNKVFIFGRHARAAFAPTPLCAVGGERYPFDIPLMAHGNDHILALDKVFVFHVPFGLANNSPARRTKFIPNSSKFIFNDFHHPRTRAQEIKIIFNAIAQYFQLIADFIAAKSCQTLQAQFQNRSGLRLREFISAIVLQLVTRVRDQLK